MAWFSSGTTNDELAMALKGHDIIKSKEVLDAFRQVDRAFFVPRTMLSRAYKDYPIREGTLHLSAPHIYAQVMEALELHPGASFLNVGSGSGYLSCLVGAITGKDSINHGLEIDPGVVDSCRASLTQYANHQRRGSARDAPPNNQVDDSDDEDGGTSELSDEDMHEVEVPQQGIERANKQVDASFSVCHVVCGDVFRMNVAKNMKYDRIYVGARAPERLQDMMKELLNPFGIVVGPFEGKLKKIRRRDGDQFSEVVLGNVTFAPMREVSNNGDPIEDAICYFPPQVWSQQRHQTYPRRFKEAVHSLMTTDSRLPSTLWLRVFEFCSYDWFHEELNDMAKLRVLLEIESNSREDAEKRALKAEVERDKFRLLLWRQQNQIQHLMARLARGELQENANNPIRAGHEGDAGDDDELVSSDDDMSDDDDDL
ncbi:hypothetical protein, variant 1 [Aphanomyces astaci]|uniref:Protein-L-isoaspartate O-methyltransferase n=2 Tax=Aphanomyces astaci TaxID=112090 RepID=W4HEF0_APHAT|nr:hypothetical protein H257_00778 [Aphanomyces astaci]XP_009821928.1 hypothetical protein, variant 1 [Aphanomyces astaci]ETV89527.1 hypothetical protein H257_00778 [Aphanomyces astaci]ETV89528.1 hypothetical protein, variant 1 [Aphanomyces astaci]|eukprot:XP_009821927.1 hypothetical protein H257_00778 [Aphanomyces astaci]